MAAAGPSGKRKRRRSRLTQAERADPHRLYEASVQNVAEEVVFLRQTFERVRGRKPRVLREDFCGTSAAACQWVKINRLHHAIGVDIDPQVLDWGRERHVARLALGARRRLDLIVGDVREVRTEPADLLIAFNFSYWLFQTREAMRDYFSHVRSNLVDDGLLFLDAFGGPEASTEQEESTEYRGFTYIWDQASFDPVSSRIRCHIHFKFPDGSRLREAFTYDWRLWTLPELRELLAEAGFSRSTVYWEGSDEDGDGTGEFTPVERGEADLAWIAYIVAEK